MDSKKLQALANGLKPPLTTVTEAAAKGATRDLLVAIRARLATAVEDPDCLDRDLAVLSRRLVEVVHEIEAIDAREHQEASRRPTRDEAWKPI